MRENVIIDMPFMQYNNQRNKVKNKILVHKIVHQTKIATFKIWVNRHKVGWMKYPKKKNNIIKDYKLWLQNNNQNLFH